MSRTLLITILAGLSLSAASAQEQAKTEPPVQQTTTADASTRSPKIEVVFVLDTTGSMSGLIEGAKQKIWSIANAMASAKPRPQIRIGLVAYRDRGDAYITKLTAMTDDLDAMYSDLMKLSADGGGDGPESVNQALHEAYTKFDWTKNEGQGRNTLRLIYLVGDAPPHMDYQQDILYKDTCADAVRHGITINTIQCGSMGDTTPIWKEIAAKSEGEYFAIQQSGGMRIVESPYDAELAKLGVELEATVVSYGSDREQATQNAKMEAAASLSAGDAAPAAKADRAVYKAGEAGRSSLTGRNDLVQACQDKVVDLSKLPEDQLPENMKKMTPAEREDYIKKQAADRAERQKKIQELSKKREEFVKNKLASEGPVKDSFDEKVVDCLSRQAEKVGIKYEKASK